MSLLWSNKEDKTITKNSKSGQINILIILIHLKKNQKYLESARIHLGNLMGYIPKSYLGKKTFT